MFNSSSGFLARSVIVLSLLLIAMGVSLFLGKALGRSIMDLTKSNIEKHFPNGENGQPGQTGGAVADAGSRSDFGFDANSFAPDQTSRDFANPDENQFSTVNDEPNVTVEDLSNQPAEAGQNSTGQGQDVGSENGGKPKNDNEAGIFDLSGSTIYQIQVGSYDSEANAESVWRRLIEAEYDAHVSSSTDTAGTKYKVYVGPFKSREEADKVAERLRSMNFSAWVVEQK